MGEDLDQRQGAAELTDFTDATGLWERSCAPTDGSWLIQRCRKIHRAGISHVGKRRPCQAYWGLRTPGSGQSRMNSENNAARVKIGKLGFDSAPLCCGVFIDNDTKYDTRDVVVRFY